MSREAAFDAMLRDEAQRAASFGRVIAILCLLAMIALPFQQGPWWLRGTMIGLLGAMAAICTWYWRSATRGGYGPRLFRIFGVAGVIVSLAVVYHVGVFSAAPVVVTLGVTFFGQGADRRGAMILCIGAAVLYLALALLVNAGVVPEFGLVHPRSQASWLARLWAVLFVPFVYLTALWHARLSRRATEVALQRAQEAMRWAQERQAQLDEANQNLKAALQAGAGYEGRFSGLSIASYRLFEVIGRGGMGEVYAAVDVNTDQRCAIKVLSRDALSGGSDAIARFRREVELTRRLRSPHVVSVRDSGELPSGAPYLVMEYLVGMDLTLLLRQRGRLPLDETVELVQQSAEGLEEAHALQIVHRDIKPRNLFRLDGPRPLWKILDFGVSKSPESAGTLTAGQFVGTPGYISPEQARGDAIDLRSDIFSLGAVIYRCLTGRPAFSGPDTPQILFAAAYGSPRRPSELRRSLPRDVDDVLALALAKQPSERFGAARELAAALRKAADQELDPRWRRRAEALQQSWSVGADDAALLDAETATRPIG